MRLPWRRGSVERLQRKGDVEGLLRLLRRRDVIVDSEGRAVDLASPKRAEAALALTHYDHPKITAALEEALMDADARVRAATLEGIAEELHPELCATLARTLPHWPAEETELRERAIGVLRDREDIWLAVFHAEELLEDPRGGDLSATDDATLRVLADVPDADEVVRSFAGRLVDRVSVPEEPERRRVCSVLAALGPAAVDPLIEALTDPARRAMAATTLGGIQDQRAIGPLSELLDDDDPAVRVIAAVALGRVRHPGTAEALIRASLDERPEVREAAQAALDQLGTAGMLAGVAAVLGPMAQRIEQLEQAAENGDAPAEEVAAGRAALLRRFIERRSRG